MTLFSDFFAPFTTKFFVANQIKGPLIAIFKTDFLKGTVWLN